MYLLIDFGYQPRVAITSNEAKQYGIGKKYYIDDDKATAFIRKRNNQSMMDKQKLDVIVDHLYKGVIKQKTSKKQLNAVQRLEKMTNPLKVKINKAESQAFRAARYLDNGRKLLR